MLLRDAVRVLPDSQIGSVLKHILRAELLLILANNSDARVRTALIKVNNFLITHRYLINFILSYKTFLNHTKYVSLNILSVSYGIFQVIQTYLQRASDEEVNKFIKQKYFMHLGNQIALYPGSEPLVVALENLVLRGPTLSAMPPLMAMIAKANVSDPNVARPIISFISDIITKV